MVVALVLVAGLSGYASWLLYPAMTALPKLPQTFNIHVFSPTESEIPAPDGHSAELVALPNSGLHMYESHSGGTVFVEFDLSWAHPLPHDDGVQLVVELPFQGARVDGCWYRTAPPVDILDPATWRNEIPRIQIPSADCVVNDWNENSNVAAINKAELSLKAVLPAGHTRISFKTTLSDSPGIGFIESRTTVDAHLPSVVFMSDKRAGDTGTTISVEYDVPESSNFDWAATPSEAGFDPRQLEWTFPWRGNFAERDTSATHARVSREDVITQDSKRVFLSGILVGIAGGALVALIQTVVESIHYPSQPRTRSRRSKGKRPVS